MAKELADLDKLENHKVVVIDDDTGDEGEEMSDETIIEKMLLQNHSDHHNKYLTDSSITDTSSVSSSCFANHIVSTASLKTSVDASHKHWLLLSKNSSSTSMNKNINPKFALSQRLNDKKPLIGVKQPMELPVLETRICEGDEVYILQLRGIKATIPRRKVGSWVNITRFKIVLSSARFKSLKKDIAKCGNKKFLKFPQWNSIYTGYWVSLDTARTLSIKYQIYNQLSPLLTFDNVAVTSYAGCKFYEHFVNLNPYTSIRILRKCENDWFNLIQLCDLYEAVNPEKSRFKLDFIPSYQNLGKQFVQHNDQTLCGGIWIPIEDAYEFAIEFGLHSKLIYILTFNRGVKVPYIQDSELNKRLKQEWKYFDKKCRDETRELLFALPNDFKLNPNINKPNFKNLQNISLKYGAATQKIQKLFGKYKQYIQKYSRKAGHTSVKKSTKSILSKILRLLSLAINLKEDYLCHLGETVKVVFPDLDKGVSLDHYLFRRYVDGHVNVSSLLRALVALRFYSHSSEDSDPEMQRENELFYMDSLNNLKTCSYIYVPNGAEDDFIAEYLHNPILEANTLSKLYELLMDRYELLTYNWDHCINGKWVSVNIARTIVHDSYQTTFKGRHLDRINSLLYSKNFDEKKCHIKYHEDDFTINNDPYKDDSDSDFECLEMRILKDPRKRKNDRIRSNLNQANGVGISYDSNALSGRVIAGGQVTEDSSSSFEGFKNLKTFEVIKFKKKIDYKLILGYDPFTKESDNCNELSDFELLDEEDVQDIEFACSNKKSHLEDPNPFANNFLGLKPGVEVVDLDSEVQIEDKTNNHLYNKVSVKHEDIDDVDFCKIKFDQIDSSPPPKGFNNFENNDDIDYETNSFNIETSSFNMGLEKADYVEHNEPDNLDTNNDLNRPVLNNSAEKLPYNSRSSVEVVSSKLTPEKEFSENRLKKNSAIDKFSVNESFANNGTNEIQGNNEVFSPGNQKLEVLSSDSSDTDSSDIVFLSGYTTDDHDVLLLSQNNLKRLIQSRRCSKNKNDSHLGFLLEDNLDKHVPNRKRKLNSKQNIDENYVPLLLLESNIRNEKIVNTKEDNENSIDYSNLNSRMTQEFSLTDFQRVGLLDFNKFANEWKTANNRTDIIELDYDDETSSDDDIIMEYTRGTIVRYKNSQGDVNSNQTHLTYFYAKNDNH